jgi:putative tricarboxylic transport membrane protein
MEILGHLIDGFGIAFEPLNLLLVIVGCAMGLFIGAMPGLGSVNGVAILLPMTFLVPPTGAIIFLAAIYYGAMYDPAPRRLWQRPLMADRWRWPERPMRR